MRRAARVDANHLQIITELRSLGYGVFDTSSIGGGFPDIVVGWIHPKKGRLNFLFEIKDGAKSASRKKLTPSEHAFISSWKGQVDVIESTEDALKLMRRGMYL